jgi:hypothetical protein
LRSRPLRPDGSGKCGDAGFASNGRRRIDGRSSGYEIHPGEREHREWCRSAPRARPLMPYKRSRPRAAPTDRARMGRHRPLFGATPGHRRVWKAEPPQCRMILIRIWEEAR